MLSWANRALLSRGPAQLSCKTSGMQTLQVVGGNGCNIQTYSSGPEDGALIVAVHGIAQSAVVWSALSAAAVQRHWRVISFDLRGHGHSDKPAEAYGDSQLWADDLAAVLLAADASAGAQATLVGWSYGGTVIGDYLAAYGSELTSGVVMVGATHLLGRPVGPYVQPAFGALTKAIATDDSGAVLEQLLDLCAEKPLTQRLRAELLTESLRCPAYVRSGMLRRTLDHDATFAALDLPVHVIHGRKDQMFTFGLAEHLAEVSRHGTLSAYDEAGHMPLWDEPSRFLDELGTFVGSTRRP